MFKKLSDQESNHPKLERIENIRLESVNNIHFMYVYLESGAVLKCSYANITNRDSDYVALSADLLAL